jgi:uncharacterized protein (TIGR02145 family)
MLKRIGIIQIIIVFSLFVQIGFAQEKAMVIHNDNGSMSTIKISDIDTLKFTENFVEDIDGNVYKTVTIGNQVWMAENLRVTRYRDGSAIPLVYDNTAWEALSTGAYCFYKFNFNNAITYGCLYNWHVVNNSRNIAPAGWHVPTDEEWTELAQYISDQNGGYLMVDGYWDDVGQHLKSTTGWNSNKISTDDYRFTAFPAGNRLPFSPFDKMGFDTYFWSATESSSNYAWYRYIESISTWFNRDYDGNKRYGFSVRLLRD